MKDILSYETSVRLKEAGFPQPTPEPGQFWYTSAGLLCWIARKELGGAFRLCDTTGTAFRTLYVDFNKDLLFAPTATDILRELPNYYYIRKYKYETDDVNRFSIFCELQESLLTQIAKGVNINPAEAAAEAWLQLNEK